MSRPTPRRTRRPPARLVVGDVCGTRVETPTSNCFYVNGLGCVTGIDFGGHSRYYYRTSHGVLSGPFFQLYKEQR